MAEVKQCGLKGAPRSHPPGLTLVELLVTLVILAILVRMILSTVDLIFTR